MRGLLLLLPDECPLEEENVTTTVPPPCIAVVVNNGRTVDTASATALAVIRAITIATVAAVILGTGGAGVGSVPLTALIAAGGGQHPALAMIVIAAVIVAAVAVSMTASATTSATAKVVVGAIAIATIAAVGAIAIASIATISAVMAVVRAWDAGRAAVGLVAPPSARLTTTIAAEGGQRAGLQ